MKKDINEVPKKYLENRESLEGKVVLSYYKEPSLIDEYPLNIEEDLLLEESKILYKIVFDMYNKGTQDMDLVSMEGYLVNLPDTKAKIEEYGGCKEVLNSAKTISTNNFDTYYDELIKNNYLIDLFQVQKKLVSKYDTMKNEMNAQEVADYTEYMIENINNTTISRKATHNDFYLSDSLLDEIIKGDYIKTISFGEYARILD